MDCIAQFQNKALKSKLNQNVQLDQEKCSNSDTVKCLKNSFNFFVQIQIIQYIKMNNFLFFLFSYLEVIFFSFILFNIKLVMSVFCC